VAVFRALQLGDLICATPALRAFRQAWPAAEITLVGLPWASEFARRIDTLVDRFAEFPGYPGLPERQPLIDRLPAFLAAMQAEEFDLAIQLHGSGRFVNEAVALWGAKRSAGFYLPGDYVPDAELYCRWPEQGLEVHRLLRLVAHLGLERHGDELEFPLTGDDFLALERETGFTVAADRPYAIVHPGASVPERRWPAERFAAVADMLARRGLAIVLTGVASEARLAQDVMRQMRHPAINLAGQTKLGALAALVSCATVVVCNDTGISHIAAALETPSVVISTGDNPARWSPTNRALHRVLCRPEGVSIDEASAAAHARLNERPAVTPAPHPESAPA
jgi:ADP-heptose:LPS heptosyltransferase